MAFRKSADGIIKKGGTQTKMMAGGGMAKTKMMKSGGMPMGADGRPTFVGDGKGKMAAGGMAKTKMAAGGGMMSKMKPVVVLWLKPK